MISTLKPAARAAGLTWSDLDRTGATEALLRSFFVSRCLANLHVVMLLELGDPQALGAKVAACPKLVSCASMDVVDDWDAPARTLVARRWLEGPGVMCVDEGVFEALVSVGVEMHDAARGSTSRFNTK